MSGILHSYYEQELRFIRQSAEDFARRYPATAGRLLLDGKQSADPQVERLLEAFALLTARIQHKLHDEFPELTDALLQTVYPHYLAPIPSMGIVHFEIDAKRAQAPNGFRIERGSEIQTQPLDDVACRCRTCYPVHLWPVGVVDASVVIPPFPREYRPPAQTESAIRIVLECQGARPFAELAMDSLRFYINSDSPTASELYELLFNRVSQVAILPGEKGSKEPAVILNPSECISDVGFGREEGMLPYPPQSFLGYRLLTELFAFPRKFRFVDLSGFRRIQKATFGRRIEVVLYLNKSAERIENSVNRDTFLLGCTPIVNLFSHYAEPIRVTQSQYQYRVIPDAARPESMEVYSVDAVTSVQPNGDTKEFEPFYSIRHSRQGNDPRTFWYSSRRASIDQKLVGTEVELSLVDLDFNPRLPADSVLNVRTTCTNGNLPTRLQTTSQRIQLRLEGAAPVSQIVAVGPLTRPTRPPLRRGAHWRLVSHLNLNHLSLANGKESVDALREILRLYDFTDGDESRSRSAVNGQLIDGIVSLQSRPTVAHTGCDVSSGFCRGTEVTIDFDEDKYVGTGVYLFAAVLERFFALHASINSFTQLVARTSANEQVLKRWLPRAGEQLLT